MFKYTWGRNTKDARTTTTTKEWIGREKEYVFNQIILLFENFTMQFMHMMCLHQIHPIPSPSTHLLSPSSHFLPKITCYLFVLIFKIKILLHCFCPFLFSLQQSLCTPLPSLKFMASISLVVVKHTYTHSLK